jgi:hypothetical protein
VAGFKAENGKRVDVQPTHWRPWDRASAFGSGGIAAGNDALSAIFGSPDVSQAVVDRAQKLSGVSSDILKKMLPVLAGIVLSGLRADPRSWDSWAKG